jgi:DNA-binding CsgD family transcriptional regulator
LPKDLPPKSTAHYYFMLWDWDGTLERIHHALYVAVREQGGREASPTVAIIDSQSGKAAQKGALRSTRRASMRARSYRLFSGMVCLACAYAKLTPRESEVLDYLVAGKSNKEVAAKLGVSPRTVEFHRAHIMEKAGAKRLPELVRIWLAAQPIFESQHARFDKLGDLSRS